MRDLIDRVGAENLSMRHLITPQLEAAFTLLTQAGPKAARGTAHQSRPALTACTATTSTSSRNPSTAPMKATT